MQLVSATSRNASSIKNGFTGVQRQFSGSQCYFSQISRGQFTLTKIFSTFPGGIYYFRHAILTVFGSRLISFAITAGDTPSDNRLVILALSLALRDLFLPILTIISKSEKNKTFYINKPKMYIIAMDTPESLLIL